MLPPLILDLLSRVFYFCHIMSIYAMNRTAVMKSLEHLFLLGALDEDCKLSEPVGKQMARLPLDPIYSKALILASNFNCLEEMLITVAMLSVESIFYMPREKSDEVLYLLCLTIHRNANQ